MPSGTQSAFAASIKVRDTTLSDWKRMPVLWEEVRRHQDAMQPNSDADVWKATVKAAVEGGEKDRRLYWEMRGRLRRDAPVSAPVTQVNVVVRP